MVLVLVLVVLVLVFLWVRRPQRPAGLPPGPPTFLIFGNVWFMIQSLRGQLKTELKRYRQTYGDILGFVLPNGQTAAHLFKYEDIRDACAMPEFAGRPQSFATLLRSYQQQLGIAFNEGSSWAEHRRFALRNLRDFGFGKKSLEETVLDEFEELADEITQEMKAPMKVNGRFGVYVLNILWKLVADQRLDQNDPKTQDHVATVSEFFQAIGPRCPLNVAPWLRHFLPEKSGYSTIIRHRESTAAMFGPLVKEHRRTLERSSPRDFIDQFLIEMESPDAEARQFTERNLAIIGMDFFVAGVETTTSTLTWALLLMVLHPDVQARVQREIDSVVGRRSPSYADRVRMPYTEATLTELYRRTAVFPLGVPRRVTRQVTFRGHTFPEDTIVLTHLDAVHMDPTYWGDPYTFRPERFINADGTFRRDERVIPFGVGKRFCLGETLARMEAFMLFTCLLQRFRFSPVPGRMPTMNFKPGVARQPEDFVVNVEIQTGPQRPYKTDRPRRTGIRSSQLSHIETTSTDTQSTMKLFVFAAVLAVAAAAPAPDRGYSAPAPTYAPKVYQILKQESELRDDQSYDSHFETENGIYASESGRPVEGYGDDEESYSVSGQFSYLGDDGVTYSVTYTADGDGFQPQGAHLPTPVPTEYPTPEASDDDDAEEEERYEAPEEEDDDDEAPAGYYQPQYERVIVGYRPRYQ
ncbi:methyl farnesoate epoxidase-like [Amphibalanus amphitrite]|uniref:methyl farnesoate epoxidase-like n=1 Tax=Amphibalanus amphitrite TaxID=1232801 RepID=UPI001C8FDB39|nr:methyl farnesoate epoxidase-like [Amphibalanus amphitrite]